jgi:hypothetical protein
VGRMARAGWRRRFLEALGRTGNVSLAARRAGVDKGTAYTLRRQDGGFAEAWERAKACADERVRGDEAAGREAQGPLHHASRGHARVQTAPGNPQPLRGTGDPSIPRPGEEREGGFARRSRVVVRFNKREGAQLVAVGAGRLSPEQQERFLDGLRETANVRASAAAVGVSTTALYNRRRRYPVLDAEWTAARETGCRRVSLMLIEAAEAALDPEADAEALGLPRVSVGEAIAILKLHRFDEAGAPSHAGARAEARARAKAVEDMPIEAVRDEVMRRIEAIRAHRERGETEIGDSDVTVPEEGHTESGDSYVTVPEEGQLRNCPQGSHGSGEDQ